MTAITGTSVDSGADTANMVLIDLFVSSLLVEGWTVVRQINTTGVDREIILNSTGTSGTEDLYIGFRTYGSVGADYYNITVAYFTGYIGGNTFTTQPGYVEKGIPAHNTSIGYWASYNKNRIVFALKVGTPVYEVGYVGRFSPYASPTEYPYPMAVFGSLNGPTATRFSTAHSNGVFTGDTETTVGSIKRVGNIDYGPCTWPYSNKFLTGGGIGDVSAAPSTLRDCNATYQLLPVTLFDYLGVDTDVFGVLDNLYFITGFNNSVENTLVIAAVNYVVIQNTNQTGLASYIALRLD